MDLTTYIPKHFQPWELVDPRTFSAFLKNPAGVFALLSRPMLLVLDTIREGTGHELTVNDWAAFVKSHAQNGMPMPTAAEIAQLENDAYRLQHGIEIWRGLRTPACKVGAPGSMHRIQKNLGTNNGFDFGIATLTAEEGRQWIHKHKDDKGMEAAMRTEAGRSWIHLDGDPGHGPRIHEFQP